MKLRSLLSTFLLLSLTACLPAVNISPRAVLGTAQAYTNSATGPAAPTSAPPLKTPTVLPTSTSTSAPTSTPLRGTSTVPAPTFTPAPTLTPVTTLLPAIHWHKQGPGTVICPILLYHRIAETSTSNPYFVSPLEFEAQMHALKDWGYASIPATLLAEALNFGAKLPDRRVVITFDDGDETVYSQAFPIMRALGLTGVIYLVEDYLGTPGYMTIEQVQELALAGWEVGSHSISHVDLTTSPNAEMEIVQSRVRLEKLLGLRVQTFAYPFGKMAPVMFSTIAQNYRAAMGLGTSTTQTRADLYYLWRRPVYPGWSLQTFGSFLPWSAPPTQ